MASTPLFQITRYSIYYLTFLTYSKGNQIAINIKFIDTSTNVKPFIIPKYDVDYSLMYDSKSSIHSIYNLFLDI